MALPAPRIIIEHSDYWLSNKGDLAMLAVTIERILTRWPHARVYVLTELPMLLRALFPEAEPLSPWGGRAMRAPEPLRRLNMRVQPRLIGPAAVGWITARTWLRRQAASRLRRVLGRPRRNAVRALDSQSDSGSTQTPDGHSPRLEYTLPPNTVDAVRKADLVLALGGGYLTDADPTQSARVLSLLEYANSLGIPTAMVGQGIGPIEDAALLSRAAAVLPEVDFIGLREGRRGADLLARVGVRPERVEVTGDDAIELSHSARSEEIGSNIGVCLRVASYSPVATDTQRTVRCAVQQVAREFRAGLVPVIISEYRSEDRHSTLPLTQGFEPVLQTPSRFAHPREVAAQVGRCRVLVTGAYHAAVFALAQGIPVVALTSSRYYDDKFLGLRDMFGGGLELIDLNADGVAHRLPEAVRSAWTHAADTRAALLRSAETQIAASRMGLDRVLDSIDGYAHA